MKFKRRAIWLTLIIVYFFLVPPSVVSAQAIFASSVSSARPGIDIIHDVFIGRSTKGPYILSWTNVESASETVILSGQNLVRGQDYTIDYASGMLAFSETLGLDAIAQITYRCVPGKSSPNSGGFSLPLNMKLLQNDRANLAAAGFYKSGDKTGKTSGLAFVGLSGDMKVSANSHISSTFLITPSDAVADGVHSSLSDRSAMKFEAATSLGALNLRASLAKSGAQFAGSNEYGLVKAGRFLDLGADWRNPSNAVFASLSYKEQENPAGDKQAITAVNVAANPSKEVGLTANVARLDAEGKDSSTTAGVGIVAQPSNQVKLTANFARTDTEGQDSSTTTGVGIVAQPIGQVKVEGNYSGKQTDSGVSEQLSNIKIQAQPLTAVKVSVGMSGKEIGTTQQTSKDASVEFSPNQNIRIASSIHESTGTGSNTRVLDYSGSLKPSNFMELSGNYENRRSLGIEDINAMSLRMALGQPGLFRLTGKYECKPDVMTGVAQAWTSTTVGVEMKLGVIGITGGYTQKESNAVDGMNTEAAVGMSVPVFANGKLITNYKMASAVGIVGPDVVTYSVGYTHIIGSSFNLSFSGEVNRYEQDLQMSLDEYKATANLGIRF